MISNCVICNKEYNKQYTIKTCSKKCWKIQTLKLKNIWRNKDGYKAKNVQYQNNFRNTDYGSAALYLYNHKPSVIARAKKLKKIREAR